MPTPAAMTKRIRIAFVTRSLEIGGAERQLVDLARALDKDRFEPLVLCLYSGGKLEQDLISAHIPFWSANKKNRWNLTMPVYQLCREIQRFRPHIVHSFLTVPNLLVALLKPFIAPSKILWGIRSSFMDLSRYDWLAKVTASMEKMAGSIPHALVANSEAARRLYGLSDRNADRMIVIPNSIDTNRFQPNLITRQEVRKELGIDDNHFLVGMIARLDPMKDHFGFLQGAKIATSANPNLRFLCVGGGKEIHRQTVEQSAEELRLNGTVQWLGERIDIERIYRALDIHTLTSRGEGFPNAVAEAMASGVPNVATNVGAVSHIMGNTGRLVPPGNPEKLAAAWLDICAMSETQRNALAISCREHVCERFSSEVIIARMEHLYTNLANID